MEKKKNDCPNKLLTTLMIVCVMLSVVILGIVSYDKFIKKEEKKKNNDAAVNCPVCEQCKKNSYLENQYDKKTLLFGVPDNYNENDNNEIIEPVKKITEIGNINSGDKRIDVSNGLSIVFRDRVWTERVYRSFNIESGFKIVNSEYVSDESGFMGAVDIITDKNHTFDVYKIGDNFLIKADYSGTGPENSQYVYFVDANGNVDDLRNNDNDIYTFALEKVEYVKNYSKPFYLITLRATDSKSFGDNSTDITYYIYEN